MTGALIALYVISAIIGLCILIWFIITLNAIKRGIEESNKALWKIAKQNEGEKKEEPEPEAKQEENYAGLLSNVDRERLKTIELARKIRILQAVRRADEKEGKQTNQRLLLQTKPDGAEEKWITINIADDEYTRLELDKVYTREELEL